MIDLSSIPAPDLPPVTGWLLWNRPKRAYQAASGGYTRKMARAAVMSRPEIELCLMRACLNGAGPTDLEIEPSYAPRNSAPPAPRADLGDLNDTELLRRLVLGLCARDRTQAPHWCVVMDSLGLTSAAAVRLCRRLNIDPTERTGH